MNTPRLLCPSRLDLLGGELLHPRLGGCIALAMFTLVPFAIGRAENWPSFRGPQGTGVSTETSTPLKWSGSENVRWRVPLPDRGNSTPAIWGDRIFVTQAIDQEKRRAVLCFDRHDGSTLWQAGITFQEEEPTNALNPYCSASPATDGQRVIACFGSPGLYCFDFDGKQIWHTDLGDIDAMHGSGASPLIHDGLCFLNFGPGTESALVACDVETGDVIWKVELPRSEGGFGFRRGFGAPRGFGPPRGRPPRGERRGAPGPRPEESSGPSAFERASFQGDFSARGGFNGSWSTPIALRVGDHEELVMAESSRVVAYDPKTGKELWKFGGLPPQVFATPAVGEDFVVVTGHTVPSGTEVIAVRLGGDGDVSETHRLWDVRWPKDVVGSGIVTNGCVFLVAENGIAICLDSKTGEKKWEKRLRGKGSSGGSWSSIVLCQDKLLIGNHSGEVFVLDASPEFGLLETNSIPDETTCASPAVAHNQVFLRTYEALWCFGVPD